MTNLLSLTRDLDERDNSKNDTNSKNLKQIILDKKWLILIGLIMIGIIIYIYYYNIQIIIPFSSPILINKNVMSDDNQENMPNLIENDQEDEWNLENEIDNYMENQNNYISTLNN